MKPAASLLLMLLACFSAAAQESIAEGVLPEGNSLWEARDKRNALLIVFKSRVLDVNDRERAIIEDVLRADPEPSGIYRWLYNILGKKLNKYIHKHGSLSPAKNLSNADYVIFFNVVEFRRMLNNYYPYGELFVIVKGSPETLKPPRIVWKARKIQFADDAIRDLIRDLKVLRGES